MNIRYGGSAHEAESGFYYLQSRYYDPVVGRFLNADEFASTGQGILGYNMFAYCLSNPARHMDDAGTAAVELFDPYGAIFDDREIIGYSSGGYHSYASFKARVGSAGYGNEWHHIVEQCQINRSGFPPESIYTFSNTVSIPTDVHRQISAFYSSKQPFTNGLTVRNWLNGQSYWEQHRFGLNKLMDFLLGG